MNKSDLVKRNLLWICLKKASEKSCLFIHEKKVGFFVYKNLPSKLIIKKQKVLYLQHFHNTFEKKFRWQVVSVFNLNSLLKLLSYLPIIISVYLDTAYFAENWKQ